MTQWYSLAVLTPDSHTPIPNLPTLLDRYGVCAIGGGCTFRLRVQEVFCQVNNFLWQTNEHIWWLGKGALKRNTSLTSCYQIQYNDDRGNTHAPVSLFGVWGDLHCLDLWIRQLLLAVAELCSCSTVCPTLPTSVLANKQKVNKYINAFVSSLNVSRLTSISSKWGFISPTIGL